MFLKFSGKAALVTGGSSGIGRATAIAFAKEGISVVVTADHNVKGGQETVDIIKSQGGEATFIKADVSKDDQVRDMVAKTVELYGSLDYAFNNAGLRGGQYPFTQCPEEEFDRLAEVDLKGFWRCMRWELIQMEKQGSGVIVNTASVTGIRGAAYGGPYIAFKHGLIGLTKCAALEYATKNIRVNCVSPGQVNTAMNPVEKAPSNALDYVPIRRFATPEEIAPAVLFLCSDGASYMVGENIIVDGGQTIGIV